MKLILAQEDYRYTIALPQKKAGRFWIGVSPTGREDEGLIFVEGINDEWVLKSNGCAQLIDERGEAVDEQIVGERELYHVKLVSSGRQGSLYAEPETLDRKQYPKYSLPQAGSFVIGSSQTADLSFTHESVSPNHIELRSDAATLTVSKPGAGNVVHLNNLLLTENRLLKPGDKLSILDLNIIVGAGFVAVNNPDGKLRVSDKLQLLPAAYYTSRIADEEIIENPPGTLFSLSPRFKREINVPTISIDSPPTEEKQSETPMLMTVGPSITMGLASGVMAISAMGNVLNGSSTFGQAAPMMIMSLIMMMGMIMWPILARRFEAKRKTRKEIERRRKYSEYLKKFETFIEQEKRKQSDILHENYVEIRECIERIRNRERSLWERAQAHNDFLELRLGLGDRPFMAEFEMPRQAFTVEDDAMQSKLLELAHKPRVLHKTPIVLPLKEQFSVGVIGQRAQTVSFIKSLLFQLAALHSYDEAKLVFIYDKEEESEWGFTRWLPHVWTDDRRFRLMANTAEEARRLSAFLEQEAIQKEVDDSKPHYIVFALSRILSNKCDALGKVVKSKNYQNVSVITLYDELRFLPKDCRVVLEIDEDRSRLYDRTNITDTYVGFIPDSNLALDVCELTLKLANTRLETAELGFELPQMLTFLEMYNAGKTEHLNARTRWRENNPARTLQAPVGVGVTGEAMVLDLHEKMHGPHGLIAGMTGSGKSEFIMTFILSLAINYHPHEVAFVLIDYKGGGMANAFADLPHTVGVITNLEGAAVNRSLVSIQSELRRRQAIFNETTKDTQVSNIDIYKYQSLYRDGRVIEPLPHLLVISDEFAELKAQQPEFMDQLVSAARIGRSLGIHLILATQKPSGVVDDQIWSNSKFKICLKVQDQMDSMEMLRRPDAASLVDVGRYYMQVGYDELFEIGQSAWAGAPYHPAERVEKKYDASVALVDLQGHEISRVSPKVANRLGKDAPKQLDEVTSYIRGISEEEGIVQKPLWLPPLEKKICLSDLREKYHQSETSKEDIAAIMGEYDDPTNQLQGPMSVSLTEGGNLLLFGATGSGKTHFLSTFIYSLITTRAADTVNFYVLDFGAETLSSFAPAPHVGDVLVSTDSEKIENLFKMLSKELKERKKLFIEYGGDYRSYAKQAEDPRPALVVMINGYSGFAETYEQGEEWLGALTREGVKYGIYFVITAQTPNAVRYNLQQNFGQHIALSLIDSSDYMALFGRLEGLLPEQTPGRGLYKNEDGIFEFQTALISEELADSTRATRQFCIELAKDAAQQKGAPAVPSLPEKVTSEFLYSTGERFEDGIIPIGVAKESLKVVCWDFAGPKATLVMSRGNEHQVFAEELAAMAADRGMTVLRIGKESFSSIEGPPAIDGIELLVIDSFASLFTLLDPDAQKAFSDWLIMASEKNDLGVVLTTSPDELNVVAYEEWMPRITSLARGIWLGEGIGDQYHLKADNIPYSFKIEKGFGFTLENGTSVYAKLLGGGEADE